MKNDFVFTQNGYTGASVTTRGHAIYDEWRASNLSSRNIVARVKQIKSQTRRKRTPLILEALAYLYALDMRIKERYGTLISRIFLLFPWRRELCVYRQLADALDIPRDKKDIRSAIELGLKMLREMLAGDRAEDDDETHGGKQSGISETENAADKNAQERTVQQSSKELSKLEEKEGGAESQEQVPTDEQIEKTDGQNEATKPPQEEKKTAVQELQEQFGQKEREKTKTENNGVGEQSQPITEKAKKTTADNGIMDIPLLREEPVSNKSDENRTSFIDEFILDNFIRGKGDLAGHRYPLREKEVGGAEKLQDALASKGDEGNNSENEGLLYENTLSGDAAQQTLKTDAAEAKGQNEWDLEQDMQRGRERIRVDLSLDPENEMRININNSMSEEAIKEIYRIQAEAMREQLSVASAAFGITEPVKIIGKPEDAPASKPNITPGKKQ